MSLPFALPVNIPVPRRVLVLGISVLSCITIFYLFSPSASLSTTPITEFSPGKWLPTIPSPFGQDYPDEWDEDGQCLFLSPFDALSTEEKERASQLVLEAVSTGIVKSSNATHPEHTVPEPLQNDDDYDSAGKKVPVHHGGMTNPIIGLLRDGERKWQDLVARQSKTLEQAVDEYRARWNREPPKGFGEWWQFVQSRNVLLPDEYDPIMTALLPYYALPVGVLQERMKEAESVAETFTLIVHDGKVELQWNDDYSRDTWWASRPRAEAQINLMEPFIERIGPFRATFTIHDQPTIMLEYERMKELTDLAKQRKLTSNPDTEDKPENNYVKACAPDSPLAKGEKEEAATDTFVASHLAAMDPCHHPSLMSTHGITLEVKNGDSHPKPHTRLLPILVLSKTTLHADIPITPVGKDGRRDDVGPDPAWSKKSDMLYWRGLATGLEHNTRTGSRWRESHRSRLHLLANDKSTARQEVLVPIGSSGEAEIKDYSLRDLGKYYMDVKLAGGPWQCDGNDGTCDAMKELFHFADKDNAEKSNQYKYVFDTDGNAWSSRFPRLMASKNMVIKASIFPEWNTQSLPEWYAYVPSKMDYSDLYSIMAFFRGVPGAKGRHDEVARRIASNGQCWVERTWRREDMQAYMYRLYLEYARLMSTDRDNGKMDFGFPPHPPKPAEPAVPDVNA